MWDGIFIAFCSYYSFSGLEAIYWSNGNRCNLGLIEGQRMELKLNFEKVNDIKWT